MDTSNLTKEQIKNKIDFIIREELGLFDDDIIDPNIEISVAFDADSLNHICILMDIENEFNINIRYEDCDNLKTPQALYDYVLKGVQHDEQKD